MRGDHKARHILRCDARASGPRSYPIIISITPTGERRNPIGRVMRKDEVIAVGFGIAHVYCDGRLVIDGERPPKKYRDKLGYCRVRHAEKAAKRNPKALWEIVLQAPLYDAAFVRRQPGAWVCVEHGEGFA